MLWTIALILLVLWALGFFAFHVAGGLIHLLLVIALVVFLVNFISGRRTV
ncbi:MAG: lmo0937 family membrane protein [Gemmatimonadales bacterium]